MILIFSEYRQQSKQIPDEDKDDEGIDSSRNDSVFNSTISPSRTSGPVSYTTEDSSMCSSGLTSLSETTYVDSSLESHTSSALTSLQSDVSVDSLPCPYPSGKFSMGSSPTHKNTSNTTASNPENLLKNNTKPVSQPKRCTSDSLIKALDWPETDNREYKRSTSVPHEKIHKTKSKPKRYRFFKRSKSLEPDTETPKKRLLSSFRFNKKKTKPAKSEKTHSTEKASKEKTSTEKAEKNTTVEEDNGVTSVKAEGFYCEEASTLKPNLSPLIGNHPCLFVFYITRVGT